MTTRTNKYVYKNVNGIRKRNTGKNRQLLWSIENMAQIAGTAPTSLATHVLMYSYEAQ